MPFNQDGVLQDQPVQLPPALEATQMEQGPPQIPQASFPLPQSFMRPGGIGAGVYQPIPNAPVGPPKIPADPAARMDLYRNLLGDFVWSLAAGAEAGAKAPPGQRNRAAFAGALMGPYRRQEAEQKLRLSQERAQQLEAATEKAMAAIGQKDQDIAIANRRADTAAQQFMSMIGVHQATKELDEARTAKTNAETATEKALQQGRIDELNAKIAKENLQLIPGLGLWDVQNRKVLAGTEPNNEITVTPELAASAFSNPAAAQAIINKKVKLSDLTPYLKPRTALATTEDSVQVVNMDTGKPIANLGKPRPPQLPIRDIPDPNNPNATVPARANLDNTFTLLTPPQPGQSLSKLSPAAQAVGTKLETQARDAESKMGVLKALVKQRTSAADQDILLKYFDIAAPIVGRRLNQTELNALKSVGTAPERIKVMTQIVGSRQIFTDDIRQEIVNAAQANVDGATKAWKDYQQEHTPNTKSLADEIRANAVQK